MLKCTVYELYLNEAVQKKKLMVKLLGSPNHHLVERLESK